MRNRYFEHVCRKGGGEESCWGLSCDTLFSIVKFSKNFGTQIDMSNIIDQAQKIIEANGFADSTFFFLPKQLQVHLYAIDTDLPLTVAFGKESHS